MSGIDIKRSKGFGELTIGELNSGSPGIKQLQKLQDLTDGIEGSANTSWYELISTISKSDSRINKETFVNNMAYAYSTLPVSPTWEIEEDLLKQTLATLEFFNEAPSMVNLQQVLEHLMPLNSDSLIASSRLLNLFFPKICPTIHSNIINSWNRMKIGGRISLNGKSRIDKYLTYFEAMNTWLYNCRQHNKIISLLDLELMLYTWNGGKLKTN